MESLRYLADEFALMGDDNKLEIVTDEIISRESVDKKLTEAYCKEHGYTNEGSGTEEAVDANQGKASPKRLGR